MLPWLLLASPLALAPVVLGGALYMLDARASYQSPLRAPPEVSPPRVEALKKLEAWRFEQAEAQRKRQEILENLTTEKMVELGKEIATGDRGRCRMCHAVEFVGGIQGPPLDGIGERAGSRVEGKTDVQYLAESLYDPEAFVVEGYSPAMPKVNEAPISLDDDEILWVVSYLQSLGGTTTVNPKTELKH